MARSRGGSSRARGAEKVRAAATGSAEAGPSRVRNLFSDTGGVHHDAPRAANAPGPLPPGAQRAPLLPEALAEADEAMPEPPYGFESDGEGDRPISLIPDEFEALDEDEELPAVAHGSRAAAPAGDAAARAAAPATDGALPVWTAEGHKVFMVHNTLQEAHAAHIAAKGIDESKLTPAQKHLPTQDPPPAKSAKARLDCQMCAHRAKQGGARSQVKAGDHVLGLQPPSVRTEVLVRAARHSA
mmetsp:Transcript_15910/g.53498  ORF Transcript_15910/g.53498 Transcript_15910/m.53498 type:complete len:242 (+) Transcript_15910:547-1272(+)